MPKESIAWFENGPVFEELRVTAFRRESPGDLTPKGVTLNVIARYPTDPKQILLSGWALGTEKIAGKAALVEVKIGKGRIICSAFAPNTAASRWRHTRCYSTR